MWIDRSSEFGENYQPPFSNFTLIADLSKRERNSIVSAAIVCVVDRKGTPKKMGKLRLELDPMSSSSSRSRYIKIEGEASARCERSSRPQPQVRETKRIPAEATINNNNKEVVERQPSDVNEHAEAFIKRFRQQLEIQRLESLDNFEKMLARGT